MTADAMLMGRNTYQAYAQAWPGRDGVRRPDQPDHEIRGVNNADRP
jgi:hypothetical protein